MIRQRVGTINLDYRSLYLHFECGAFIYNNSEIDRIERDFQETLEKCHKVTLMEVKNRITADQDCRTGIKTCSAAYVKIEKNMEKQ